MAAYRRTQRSSLQFGLHAIAASWRRSHSFNWPEWTFAMALRHKDRPVYTLSRFHYYACPSTYNVLTTIFFLLITSASLGALFIDFARPITQSWGSFYRHIEDRRLSRENTELSAARCRAWYLWRHSQTCWLLNSVIIITNSVLYSANHCDL